MSTVYQYRVYCIEEGKNVNVWATTTPKLCPNNHTDRSIDPNRTTVVSSLSTNTIKAEEPTEGYFQATTVEMNIPSGSPGDVTLIDVSWPMDILIWKTEFNPVSDMMGDKINVIGDPGLSVGALTADASATDTVLNVSNTVTDNVIRGFDVQLTDGSTTEKLGRIVGVDKDNFQITVENALTNNFLASSPTYVQLNVCSVKDFKIDTLNKTQFGEKGFRYKTLPANTVMRLEYTNNNGLPKIWNWRIEYYITG